MHRIMSHLALVVLASGCAARSGAPGDLPDGASQAMYTTSKPETVARCIAAALGTTAEPTVDRFVVASDQFPGVRYNVGPNRKDSVYPTQIALTGLTNESDESTRAARCAVAQTSAADPAK